MTVTERERRRMELVDGSAHRTDLCELLAMREYELDNLKEENAKLLQQLADVTESMGRVDERCAKLRELCKELLNLCYDAYEEKWGWDDDWALAYEQAKKLGVEVSA